MELRKIEDLIDDLKKYFYISTDIRFTKENADYDAEVNYLLIEAFADRGPRAFPILTFSVNNDKDGIKRLYIRQNDFIKISEVEKAKSDTCYDMLKNFICKEM